MSRSARSGTEGRERIMNSLIVRVIITAVAVIFLIWFLSPLFFGVKSVGTVLGVMICCVLIFRFGFFNLYMKLKTALCGTTAGTVLVRVIQIGACAFLLYAIVVSGFMIYAMNVKPQENSTAVVLGAQVKPWGPSTLLRQRIDAAYTYLENDPEATAVLTGGKGSDEIMSEAQCMYENLTEYGISPARLYQEDQATNTEQNIRYSLQVIKDNALNSDIAVVTDSYHQLRARIITAKIDPSVKVGAINTKNNYIGLSAYPTYFVREWIAIPVEILK